MARVSPRPAAPASPWSPTWPPFRPTSSTTGSRSPDGTPKGTWQIEAISGSNLTLEAGATVAEGDLWAGVYRFDSLIVQGRVLTIPELDDIGVVTVSADSTLSRVNRRGPTLDPSAITISAHHGAYWLSGGAGAVTDQDGIGSAEIVNLVTSAATALAVTADGSFPPVPVAGAPGDGLELRAADAHPSPKSNSASLGPLASNPDAPALDAGLIAFTAAAGEYRLNGVSGAAADSNPPLTATVANTTTAWEGSVAVGADGAFDLIVEGAPATSSP